MSSVRAAVVSAPYSGRGHNPAADVLQQAGLRSVLRNRDSDDGSPAAVVLVPLHRPAMPNAGVLHDVIDALAELGWSAVTVGTAPSQQATDLGTTDVNNALADAGYVGMTARGNSYTSIDLSRGLVSSLCPQSSVLAGAGVSSVWAQSGLRVVVARWTDDPQEVFRGCVSAVLNCADPIPGAAPADVAADIVMHLPPTVSIIEARRDEHSYMLISSGSAVLTDVVSAVLHGENPTASHLVDGCVQAHGLPENYRIVGDVEPLPVSATNKPSMSDALRRLDQSLPDAARILRVLMSGNRGDRDVDEVLGWLQRTVGPLVDPGSPGGPAAVSAISSGLATAAESISAWRTNFNKDNMRRVVVPLGFDPRRYRASDYRRIPKYLAGFTALLDAAPRKDPWVHWCYFDRSVLFSVERVVNARYADWIARVDVAQGISMMADYLGGRIVPMSHDDSGRVVMQAERNIYLPQPNYLAFWGGKVIDVCKIELVHYRPDCCRLYWRTVLSPNDSAVYDDGELIFADNGDQTTRVTISGRQQFRLPPFWEAVDLDRYPEVKSPLVTDAYRRFFNATFDNFEACFEGRPYKIGADARPSTGLPTETWSTYLDIGREWLAERGGIAETYHVDEQGFRHFEGTKANAPKASSQRWSDALRPILSEYAAALRTDMARRPRW
jgi:hypothetical protein